MRVHWQRSPRWPPRVLRRRKGLSVWIRPAAYEVTQRTQAHGHLLPLHEVSANGVVDVTDAQLSLESIVQHAHGIIVTHVPEQRLCPDSMNLHVWPLAGLSP